MSTLYKNVPSGIPVMADGKAVITGIVNKIFYKSRDRKFTAGILILEKECKFYNLIAGSELKIRGNVLAVYAGDKIEVKGNWVDHPIYGLQFNVTSYRYVK